MKLRITLLALVGTVAVGVGSSQANITSNSLGLTATGSAAVQGSTVFYGPQAGSVTVTVTDTTDAPPLTVDFPSVFADDPASGPATSHMYSWAAGATDSGVKTVSVTDASSGPKTHQFTVTPDVPVVTNKAPTEGSGAGDQYWDSATNTLWFRPTGSGSFTLNANVTDPYSTSGAKVTFPDVSTTAGWAGSKGGDASTPFASPTYTWAAGAAAPGAKVLTATNGLGGTSTAAITISGDAAPPSGQAVTLNGGPWFSSSVPLTLVAGADAGAGVDASRTVVERASAIVTNGVCGTYGSFAPVTLTGGSDTTVASGNCYRYQSKTTDNVGNVSGASASSADAKVDKTAPTTPALLFTGMSNMSASGNVVFFRPGGSGSFTVSAATSDPESGISTYSFPDIPGFTAVGTGPHRTYTTANAGPPTTTTFAVTSTNAAGVNSSVASFTLSSDGISPTLAVRCNGAPCRAAAYAKTVMLSFKSIDFGGSGLQTIRWTADGTIPTATHGYEYVGRIPVQGAIRVKARAFDRAGNASPLVALRVKSLANRLLVAAPTSVVVKAKAHVVEVRLSSTKRALVTATMAGPGLKKPLQWHFVLDSGTSIVQLHLPAAIKRAGKYRVTWSIVADSSKALRTTNVELRG